MTMPDSRGEPARAVAGWEPIVRAIGPKVREVRQQLALSLQQLAARSDVSAAAIHKVERGDMVPTITTLLKLSAALGRPIGFFVDDGPEKPVAVHVRAAERPGPPPGWAPEAEGVTAAGLALSDERLRGAAVQADIDPGGSSGDTRPLRPGEELLLVVAGALIVEVAGERYRVQAGDTLHYPTDRPHSWHNPGVEPARAIWWMLRA
ncbi:cupin domain-containing protein [Pseudonocardia asaccharolytica]|uniref:Transcriptional regulator n=1 Tax=Pseudonocardia asaccharolytica DSM 44247 = NBRC 16224 TaxID=1123024 RepID=A0A511D8C4_9PSEU|nr:cupin domain-containing protein [Pseudonocardia asaccharolytica]GEL20867.1 transcriptional regulator [Pseudonocardia asaccharolytica DSM 44247 = NBRC 16224]